VKFRNPFKRKVEKNLAQANDTLSPNNIAGVAGYNEGRGIQIYTMSQLMGITGNAKGGERIHGRHEQPLFYLSIEERINIYRLCAPVFAVVTSRMNRIAGLDWHVNFDKDYEDKTYEALKTYAQIYNEYLSSTKLEHLVVKSRMLQEIKKHLPDVLDDMSNFQTALSRWRRRIQTQNSDNANEVASWLKQPNIEDKFEDFVKKMIFDLMIHGAFSVYKENLNGMMENIYALPGGTVLPLKNIYAGGVQGFVQVITGFQPQIFFANELAYTNYIPSTARNYGFIPLEALINKIAETLMFDKLMAEQADGTKMPEKMVIVSNPSPFGSEQNDYKVPLDVDEQHRVEKKINTPIKGAIMTFTGNTATVVDLTRENTMAAQMTRQKDIREEVGMVFQATPMEMSLDGSENTSGRSTSETQESIFRSSGILPIIKIIEAFFEQDILPFKFGTGFKLEFNIEKSEREKMEALQAKMNTGLFSVNEVRVDDLNLDPYSDPKYDFPQGGQTPGERAQNIESAMRDMGI
jgi:hypothetical protein